MLPEWTVSLSFDLKEEDGRDGVDRLDEVLADKETAGAEVGTGAHPFS